jgi:hypothetical protein
VWQLSIRKVVLVFHLIVTVVCEDTSRRSEFEENNRVFLVLNKSVFCFGCSYVTLRTRRIWPYKWSTSFFGPPTIVVALCSKNDGFSTSTRRKIYSVFQILSSPARPRKVQTRHDEVCGCSDFQAQGEHNADGVFDEL